MSVIDSILDRLDGYRWGLIRAQAAAKDQERAIVVDKPQGDESADMAVGEDEPIRADLHTTELAELQDMIGDSQLSASEKDGLSLFVRRTAMLITEEDWGEYIVRMKQMIGLKTALQNEYRLAGRLSDVLDELDEPDAHSDGGSVI